jgi:hypothetical protein
VSWTQLNTTTTIGGPWKLRIFFPVAERLLTYIQDLCLLDVRSHIVLWVICWLVSSHFFIILIGWSANCRSQWPRGLRHELSSPARNTGIMGSNPTRGMDVCVRLFFVCALLCVCSGLATGWSPVQGVLATVYRTKKMKKRPRSKRLYSQRERSDN